jgi:hypothetical protein
MRDEMHHERNGDMTNLEIKFHFWHISCFVIHTKPVGQPVSGGQPIRVLAGWRPAGGHLVAT